MRIVATAQTQGPQVIQAPDGWVPPGGYEGCTEWALDNRVALEHYARQVEEEGTAAEQLQSYLTEHPEIMNDDHFAT